MYALFQTECEFELSVVGGEKWNADLVQFQLFACGTKEIKALGSLPSVGYHK
jgi:hypothetical protein